MLTDSQRSSLSNAANFFKLYFTLELFSNFCLFANHYAISKIHKFTSYDDKERFWSKLVSVKEMYSSIGLVIFMGILELPSRSHYWSSSWTFYTPDPQALAQEIILKAFYYFESSGYWELQLLLRPHLGT